MRLISLRTGPAIYEGRAVADLNSRWEEDKTRPQNPMQIDCNTEVLVRRGAVFVLVRLLGGLRADF
jgi:hypothetical protein